MANVKFLRGLASSLPSQATDGAFYLTTDTNRLYVGQGTSLVELNKSITVVDVINNPDEGQTALPTTNVAEGQFYYVKNSNILCVYDAQEEKWVQINPDTDTNTTLSGTTINFTEVQSGQTGYSSEAITFNVSIPLSEYDIAHSASVTNGVSTTLTGTFSIGKAAINSLAGVAVGLEADLDSTNTKITLNNNGGGAVSTSTVVLSAGNNISFSQDQSNNDFVISADGYEISTNSNGIIFGHDLTQSPTSITFSAGSLLTRSVDTSTKTITFGHATPVASTTDVTKGSVSNNTLYIPTIKKDGFGHITSLTETSYAVPIVAPSLSLNGKSLSLVDENQNTQSYGNAVSLPFYTTAEVDAKIQNELQALNGLTYIGTTDSVPTASTSSISVGDMYLLTSDVSVQNSSGEQIACKTGDLIIANTSATPKESNGYITESLYWDRIKVDYNTDTNYYFSTSGNTFIFHTGDTTAAQAAFSFATSSLDIGVVCDSTNSNTINIDLTWGTF